MLMKWVRKYQFGYKALSFVLQAHFYRKLVVGFRTLCLMLVVERALLVVLNLPKYCPNYGWPISMSDGGEVLLVCLFWGQIAACPAIQL